MRIKRLTAILLCLCMALTLLPATAWAADGETIHVGGVTLTGSADTPAYAKTDNSGNVTVESASEDDYNIKWDGTTLTLDNANISGGYGFSGPWDSGSAAIYYSGGSDISLILTGENTVTGPNGDNNASFGIYACGDSGNIIDFTISGSGSLTATGGDMVSESYGIFTDNLIVQSGTVNAAGGNGNTVNNSYGIYVYIYLTISGGTVTAEGSTQAVFNNTGDIIVLPARDRQIAVTAGEDASSAVAVTGSPFTRKTTITDLISDAEYFHSEVTEATDPNPNPDPGDPDDPGGDDDPEPNICVGGVGLTGDKDTPAYALTDKNGTVTKDSATADNYNIMWDGETLTLRNATISGGNVFDGDKSAAIYYIQESPLNLMLVGDNAVTGPSGEGIEKSYGISACGTDDYIDLTISGAGTLTATGGDVSSGTYTYSYGIYGDNIIVESGTITATGGDAIEFSIGISAVGLTISGGTVTTEGVTAEVISAGVTTTSDFAISGGQITASGDDSAEWSYGIYAGEILIVDGEITAQGGSAAITRNQVTVRPAAGRYIEVLSGGSEAEAKEIAGSPFASETVINDLLDSVNKYFHSYVAGDTPPEPEEFTITFDASGGTTPAPQTTVKGRLTSLPVSTRYGYDFLGWYTADGDRVTTSTVFTADATLYASWDRHDSGDSSDHPARPSQPSAPSYAVSTVDADNGEVDVDLSRVQAGEEVTITATPDEGYEVEAVTVTDRDGEEINVTEAGDGVYTFEMPDSRVTIEVTFAPVAEEPEPPAVPDGWANPYGDVAANAWYYDAVAYVSASGMMTGTSAAAFSPDDATTRAMIWTVLARLNGQSVDGGSPWYAAAQSWAVSAGVSDGTDPAGNITREALAAMLYRAAGSPAVSGNFLAFSDGDSVSSWAESAMLWATQNGIIGGIDGALAPQGQATRAQVAAMLQRFMESGGLGAE